MGRTAGAIATLTVSMLVATGGAAAKTLFELSGDYIGMVQLEGTGGPANLAVFTVDQSKPKRKRSVTRFIKRQGGLAGPKPMAVPQDAAAYDACRLRADEPTTLLYIRPDGIYKHGEKTALVKTETLFPHVRDDALPRVRLCMALFPGEGPALAVPTLAGIALFRQEKPGAFTAHAQLRSEPDLRFQWPMLRGEDLERTQRIALRLEYPDLTAIDFNGDGKKDLCFNHSDNLTCYLQSSSGTFLSPPQRFDFDSLDESEAKDTSVRLQSRLVELSGDRRPDLVITKANWNIAAMGTTLNLYVQNAAGGFPKSPTQVIERKGYFAFQEYFDFDGDGLADIVAPVAALGWTDLVGIYWSKSAAIEFIWYKNLGGRFATESRSVHSFSFPVEFKNMAAILGALPLWDVKLRPRMATGERQIVFFPGKEAVELYTASETGTLAPTPLWQQAAHIGSEILATDLDGDGLNELVFAYPRDPERADRLLFIDSP